jgi:uncharacterized membrane protein (UPF0127 family)
MRTIAAIAMVSILALGGCGPPAFQTVTLGGEPWMVLDGDRDGMRGRAGFDGADGMLFAFDPEVDTSGIVWVMDGVAFPLDIAWFDDAGALVGTASMATCTAAPCPTYGPGAPYRFALEAPVGAFDDLRPADRLVIED